MLSLNRPSLELLPSYLEFIGALEANGDTVWPGMLPSKDESENQFINQLISRETTPLPGRVPETVYWGALSDTIVGRISIRHWLDEDLKAFGGHISYETHPWYRKKGIATEMLRLILETPKARELKRILLTCSPTNIGSINAIIANGGSHEKTVFVERVNRETSYYWIQIM